MNFVIIMTDQQHFSTISHYVPGFPATPNINRLIDDGRLYVNYYSPHLVCMPARAAYLSGLNGFSTGVWANGQCLIPRKRDGFSLRKDNNAFDTFGDLFRRAGYTTAAIGKLHFTPTQAPPMRAFPESRKLWDRIPGRLNAWSGPYFGFDYCKLSIGHVFPNVGATAWGHFHAWLNAEADAGRCPRKAELDEHGREIDVALAGRTLPDQVRKQLLAYPRYWHQENWVARQFDSFLAGLDAGKRFLAFLGLEKPHHPYQLSYETARDNADYICADTIEFGDPDGKYAEASRITPDQAHDRMDPAIVGYMSKLYRLSMIDVDHAVGRVVEALEQKGLLDETMIVFTSDHGDFAGEHGLLRKSIYPTHSIFHVPLVIRPAGGSTSGTVRTPCSGYDLFPSLADAAGIDCERGDRQGCSLFGDEFETRKFVNLYTWGGGEVHVTSFDGNSRYSRGLRSGNEDFFDLTSDAYECSNLVDATQARAWVDLARERTRSVDALGADYDGLAHARRWSKW